jgi:PmbA protein
MHSNHENPEDLLGFALATAKKYGATAADAMFSSGVSTEIKIRLGSTENVKQSRSKGIGLRVFIGDRSATTSTSDLSRGAIENLIRQTCEAAVVLAEDALSGLPDEHSFTDAEAGDLELFDEGLLSFDVEQAIATAKTCEAAAFDADPRITKSEGADMSWGHSESMFANSLGIFRKRRGGSAGFWTCPIAEDKGGMERDYWYTSARHLSDLMDPETVGSIAAQRTLRRLGATQPATASVPVIYENTVASRLLGSLAGAICGGSVYRQLSYLAGKLGERIASDKVSIRDDPHILRGASSREYDGEGLATRPLDVVTNGILDAYLLDTYSAKKLGMASTRSASRGLGSTPSASPSNFWMAPGNQSLEELIAEVKNGVLITELMGFGTNTVTGDYSQGASGVWIENGKLTRPVNEMTVASTLQQMWCGIDGVANDLDRRKGLSAPSFRINQMTVGGA